MKEKFKNIYNDYKTDFIEYKNLFVDYIKDKYQKFKIWLKEKPSRKRNVIIASVSIIVLVLILKINPAFSYYTDEASIPIVRAEVGDITIKNYDYVLQVYLQDVDEEGNGNSNYHLASLIPSTGYVYNRYNCKNNSTLVYNAETKTTSISSNQKEVCSIYFNVLNQLDLSIKIMLEDSPNSNTYSLSDKIPAFGYKYERYTCKNSSALNYNSELHSITVDSTGKEFCSIYFKKDNVDIEVELYIEDIKGSGNHIKRNAIPSNKIYSVNTSKSSCQNNGEGVEANITYTDGYLYINAPNAMKCNIYLDEE